jgi:hypothetical protein
MYKPRHLLTAIREPDRFFAELHSLGVRANIKIHDQFRSNHGLNVMEENWDNLVILDGCRYDLFEQKNTIEGDLRQVTSMGSESWEFLSANFEDQKFHDTVYITANPHAPKLAQGTFHRTINLLEDNWSERFKTVLPETVTAETLAAHNEYPNKRIIAHFMQPHFPFIGTLGQEISHMGINVKQSTMDDNKHVWNSLQDGQLKNDLESIKAAYYENLEVVLPSVKDLSEALDGKTVVTADHGNMLGERTSPIPARAYGHPRGLKQKELIRVPWLEIAAEERREITSDPPVGRNELESETVSDRLENLGYA